ncbi:LOW QUALITY PROTEIN: digalactosyldiacylglycerol synthase 1, chloroplastic [Brachypodium distachyon]|uniref:LOW QUALITY PROTEIN: digalactosyldiacylglycerol synthase 1, chloroplastic n=1 Tax=Brachypodium distachyon TaxID=15368 RepID=UPI00071D04EE|nr:LOW QUALITY PROTEIN: digalactosyldiacylglycerol synthase 1, chloroplastic [Brachypodium distachyon]|eukprot:XP_003575088.2 LOW QUALITY PROTEIN: digalactosyldiacylglycerol synthase 1, chloroplastic [Brachypodium distachyon]
MEAWVSPIAGAGGRGRGGDDSAFSFLSKGWREVRDSASADLRLMRARADSLRTLADRELEHLLASASTPLAAPPPPLAVGAPIAELEFVRKQIQPKISELRRQYASRDRELGRRVLERWVPPRGATSARVDLSGITAIRNAIVSEARDAEKWRRTAWNGEADTEEKEWEVVRMIRVGLKELERRSQSSELLGGFRGTGELVEKFKSSLKSFNMESEGYKEVPPLDITETLANLIRQSGPFLDQFGLRRDLCDKLVETLYSKQNHSLSAEATLVGNDSLADDLDLRIASVLQSTGYHTDDGFWNEPTKYEVSDTKRHIAVVTTASLPWMTGTAVNPLFRAAYLAKSEKQDVTLVVPWLCRSDQELVYPYSVTFNSPEEQETYIRNWVDERLGFASNFKISFYPGKFSKERRSILPAGDTSQFISSREADIAILEEPEHLNWYHHGKRWTEKFNHVVGIVHTNYLEYIKREKNGALQAFLVKHINNWVTRAYCDKVLRLSAATQDLPKSIVCNVHGVNPKFLKIGDKLTADREGGQQSFSKGAYFLGKMVWAKGYRELVDLLAKHKGDLEGFKLDVYGSGEDSQEVHSTARKLDLNLKFFKGMDHADDSLHRYKVFINPSISDVLCTATAEALAMGKFVVCAEHPSNEFFMSFPNCLTYKTSDEFVARVKEAMAREPQPLTPEERYNLSWEAATERFMEYSDLDKVLNDNSSPRLRETRSRRTSQPSFSNAVDGGLAFAHRCLTGSEVLRLATGAIPGTRDYDESTVLIWVCCLPRFSTLYMVGDADLHCTQLNHFI